jgi:hypothetical protein
VVSAVWKRERIVYAGASSMPSSHTTLFPRAPTPSEALAQRQVSFICVVGVFYLYCRSLLFVLYVFFFVL